MDAKDIMKVKKVRNLGSVLDFALINHITIVVDCMFRFLQNSLVAQLVKNLPAMWETWV